MFGGPNDAVAASRWCAGVRAGIVVHLIAIIAGFVALVLDGEILTNDPIATASLTAIIPAGISVFSIAIIAGLPLLHEFITTGWQRAVVGAAVEFLSVAVIAVFHAGPADAITALGQRTGIRASILVHPIAVIAVFVAVILGSEVVANDPIPTAGESAVRQTGICIVPVAIVAGFAGLHDPIAAGGGATFVARVLGIFIPVIAALTRADDSIAADIDAAVGFAGILVHCIAVVAGLIAWLLSA